MGEDHWFLDDMPILRPGQLERYERGMFHITGHGIDDMHCFGDRSDKLEFIERFARVLSPEPVRDPVRREAFPNFRAEASLVAFCVLDNHYHLILRQFSALGARRVMRSVLRSYVHWFNGKYARRNAPVFERPFAARRIGSKRQGVRTLNYVHLNHENERQGYEFCSHDYYTGARAAPWVDTSSGLWFHDGSVERYLDSLFGEGVSALEAKIAARRPSARRKIPRGRPSHIAKPARP